MVKITRSRDVATQGGLVLLNTTTFSAQTSVSLNNCFSSTYDNYKVIFTPSATQVSAQNQINLRVRTAGTDLTSASYFWSRVFYYHAGTGTSGSVTETFMQLCDSNAGLASINFDIYLPFAALKTQVTGATSVQQITGGPFLFGINYAGLVNNTTSYDGFTLVGTSAISGTIEVYGYK